MVFCRQWSAMKRFLFSMSHRHIYFIHYFTRISNKHSKQLMHLPTWQSQKHGKTRLSKAIQEQKTSQEHCVQCSTNVLHSYRRRATTKDIKWNTNKRYSFIWDTILANKRHTFCSTFYIHRQSSDVCTMHILCTLWKWIEAQFPIVLFVSLCFERFIYVNMNCRLGKWNNISISLSILCICLYGPEWERKSEKWLANSIFNPIEQYMVCIIIRQISKNNNTDFPYLLFSIWKQCDTRFGVINSEHHQLL